MTQRPERTNHATSIGPLERSLGRVGRVVGLVGEPVYRFEIARRNRRFDAGVGVTRLDRPVISVGNLSVGGTGKTPLVALLVRTLRENGKRPCIAMRGYAAKGGESDEAAEYARLFPDVPIVAQADRAAGLAALFGSSQGAGVDCVVLDDGFQHRKIARDLDIVLVDASAGTLDDRLLPAGWLREPVGSLGRAGAVVVTHAELAPEGEVERWRGVVGSVAPGAAFGVCRHAWTGLMDIEGAAPEPVAWLRGKRVVAVCAIGNPGGFLAACRGAGAEVAGEIVLPDHDPYEAAALGRIKVEVRKRRAEAIVTTEKDWSKLRRTGSRWACPVVRPRLGMVFDEGWEGVAERVGRAVGIDLSDPTLCTGPGTTARG